MRYLLFLLPLTLWGQTAETDSRLTQTLINEIQQLRLAIERSTLLGARTQLAVSALQLQESTVSRLSQQYNDTRAAAPSMTSRNGFSFNRIPNWRMVCEGWMNVRPT